MPAPLVTGFLLRPTGFGWTRKAGATVWAGTALVELRLMELSLAAGLEPLSRPGIECPCREYRILGQPVCIDIHDMDRHNSCVLPQED